VQRDHAFGVALADRDAEPGMTVGVGVEAVHSQSSDLVTTGTAPPRDDQRSPLVGIGQLVDRGHQGGEFVLRDEPRQRMVDLRDIGSAEQHPSRDVVPLPGGGFGDEPGDQSDDRTPERHAQRGAGVLTGLRAEPT